jgi:hypothetical protein
MASLNGGFFLRLHRVGVTSPYWLVFKGRILLASQKLDLGHSTFQKVFTDTDLDCFKYYTAYDNTKVHLSKPLKNRTSYTDSIALFIIAS